MSKSSLKISDGVMSHLRTAADANRRSLAGQAEHWMRLGREAEVSGAESPRLARAMRGEASIDELPGELQEAFLDALDDLMRNGSPEVDAAYAALGARPGAVGYVGSRLMKATADGRAVPVESGPAARAAGNGRGSRKKAAATGHGR